MNQPPPHMHNWDVREMDPLFPRGTVDFTETTGRWLFTIQYICGPFSSKVASWAEGAQRSLCFLLPLISTNDCVHSIPETDIVVQSLSCVWLCATPWAEQRPPGSSVHRVLQARILERVAIPSSRASSRPRDPTHVFYISCIGRQVLNTGATWEVSPAVAKSGPWGSGPWLPELGRAPGKLGVLLIPRTRVPSAFMSLRQHCWGREHFPQENDSQLFQERRPTPMTQQKTANSIHLWCLFSPEILSLRVKVYHIRSPLTYFWSPGRWERWEIVWKRLMRPQAVFPGAGFSPLLFASPPA